MLSKLPIEKWHILVKVILTGNFVIEVLALFDTSADLNCIQEHLVPSQFLERIDEGL
jgi:hypothetical protein